MKMFSYYDEFYKAAFYHFIVSAVCAALFALGMEFSRGSDGDVVAYYIPAMVLAGIHFFLSITALLLFAVTKRNELAMMTTGSRSEVLYNRLKSIYTFLNFPSFIWSIIGASMAGNSGICASEDSKCSYTVNTGINRTIAIIILVIHVLNAPATYLILATSRSPSRTHPLAAARNLKIKTTPKNKTLPLSHVSTILRKETDKDKEQRKQTKPIKTPLVRNKSELEMTSSLSRFEQRRNQYYDDSLIGRRIPPIRPTPKGISVDDVKPLPKKNKKLLLPVLGKFVIQYNGQKRKHADDNVEHSSTGQYRGPQMDATRIRRLPPPSYNDVISEEPEINPYWLPPLPNDNPDLDAHRLPENMYSGNSYPDTEIIVTQPTAAAVSKP